MSPYSTLNITRDDARMLIMKKMFNFTDEQMEDMLFSIYGNKTLNNFNIIRQYEETSEDECSLLNQYKGQEWRFES
jgi:hypothetical protein